MDFGGYSPIGDYAVIGDCHSAALVSRTGSIDWYCPLRFDAPAVFCRLLDSPQGGYFSVAPADEYRASRRYLDATNVLQTTFQTPGGDVRLTDFMTIHHPRASAIEEQQICRLVECEGGESDLGLRFKPTFDFAQGECELTLAGEKGAIAHAGGQYMSLYAPKFKLERQGPEIRGRLRARRGEHTWLVATACGSRAAAERALDMEISMDDLRRAAHHWQTWAERCNYEGPYKEASCGRRSC